MGLRLVTPPITEPATLLETKNRLRVTHTSDDGRIAGHILTARQWAENYIRGCICRQTWDYTVDHDWPFIKRDGYYRHRIELPLHPLIEVSSISYVDSDGATQTLSTSLYTVHKNTQRPYIEQAYDQVWPSVRRVPEAITVRFVAGYDQVPDGIRDAVMLHVELLYDLHPNDRETWELTRDALLDPYRVLEIA